MADSALPAEPVIDIRELSPQQSPRRVIEAYAPLNVGDSLIVLANQEPAALRGELERELAGAFSWDTMPSKENLFRVRITKHASTALPRVVADTTQLFDSTSPDAAGSIWRLEPGARDLDSNIITLPPEGEIAQHVGPNLDVLIVIIDGSGELQTELDTIALQQGQVVWLPAKARRRFTAGRDGLRYLTVHQRKPTLNISRAPDR